MNKWNKKDIPHKGWQHLGCNDLGQATHICEMCDKEQIRYVHKMYHPEMENYFNVGCICAEKLTNDYVNPKLKLKELINQTAWITQHWKINDFHEYEEKNFNSVFGRKTVGVFKVDDHYRYHIDYRISETPFESKNKAKLFVYENYKD